MSSTSNGHHLAVLKASLALLWSVCLFGVWHVFRRRSERMKYWAAAVALSLPSYPLMVRCLTLDEATLVVAGMLLYLAGAVVFGKRMVDPVPQVLGFHEVFHMLTVAAALCTSALLCSLCLDWDERCSARIDAPLFNQLRAVLSALIGARHVCAV